MNYEGEFTEEKISRLIIEGWQHELDHVTKLGLMIDYDGYFHIQGIVLGNFEREKDVILLVGFDSNHNNRFVTPIKIAASVYNEFLNEEYINEGLSFYIFQLPTGKYKDFGDDFIQKESIVSTEQMLEYADAWQGKCVIFALEAGNLLEGGMPDFNDIRVDYFQEIADKEVLAKKIVSELFLNNMKIKTDIKDAMDAEIVKSLNINNIGNDFEIGDDDILITTYTMYYY